MNYLPFTLIGYLLNSVSVTIDKYLLVKKAPNPIFYIFYISLFSEFVLVGIPFVSLPSLGTFSFASLSTVLWTAGAYFMFRALKIGNPVRVVPIIGTLIPIILGVGGFINQTLSIDQFWSILILVFGLFFLVLPYLKGKISRQEVISITLSAVLFAISYIVLKLAYESGDFTSVFVYSRVILIPFLIVLYLVPVLKKKFLKTDQHQSFSPFSKNGLLFLTGQMTGGASQLLLTFSISLANPALVNALQGIQYVFLLIFGLILSKKLPTLFGERLSKALWIARIIGIILIATGLYMAAIDESSPSYQAKMGVTFSPRYAAELGLDPLASYIKMFSVIDVKYVRLPLYWDEFEDQEGEFTDTLRDYLDIAERNHAQVIIAAGYKAPRWPECYPPEWARNLSREELQEKILLMIHKAVVMYKDHPAVSAWQIENEPFLAFGDCPAQNPLTYEFVKQEVAMVKQLDNKKVLITDSGEISSWAKAITISDYFGTTMYRQVWTPYLGWFDYPLPSFFYNAKNWLVRQITGAHPKPTIVSELQAEPWVPSNQSLVQWNIDEQHKAFPPERLHKHVNFALSTGFPEIYLWGVEWWLWMDKNGYPEYLDTAKQIFDQSQ